jgi:hypothetical protein
MKAYLRSAGGFALVTFTTFGNVNALNTSHQIAKVPSKDFL